MKPGKAKDEAGKAKDEAGEAKDEAGEAKDEAGQRKRARRRLMICRSGYSVAPLPLTVLETPPDFDLNFSASVQYLLNFSSSIFPSITH